MYAHALILVREGGLYGISYLCLLTCIGQLHSLRLAVDHITGCRIDLGHFVFAEVEQLGHSVAIFVGGYGVNDLACLYTDCAVSGNDVINSLDLENSTLEAARRKAGSIYAVFLFVNSHNRRCHALEYLACLVNGDRTLLGSVVKIYIKLCILGLVACKAELKGLAVLFQNIALYCLYLGQGIFCTHVHNSLAAVCPAVYAGGHLADKVALAVDLCLAEIEILCGFNFKLCACKRFLGIAVLLVNEQFALLVSVGNSHLVGDSQSIIAFRICRECGYIVLGQNEGSRNIGLLECILVVGIDRNLLAVALSAVGFVLNIGCACVTVLIGSQSAELNTCLLNGLAVKYNIICGVDVEGGSLDAVACFIHLVYGQIYGLQSIGNIAGVGDDRVGIALDVIGRGSHGNAAAELAVLVDHDIFVIFLFGDDIDILEGLAVQLTEGQMLDAGIAVLISLHSPDAFAVKGNIEHDTLDLHIVDNIVLVDLDLQLKRLVLYLIAVIGQLCIGEGVGIVDDTVAAVDLVESIVKHIARRRCDLLDIVIDVGQKIVIEFQLAVCTCNACFQKLFA